MAIVHTVSFEVVKAAKGRFEAKFRRDKESLDAWKTCLENDVWVRETEDSVIFLVSSKWAAEEDFRAWMKRPQHTHEHKEAMQKRKETGENPILRKELNTFEILD